MKQCNEHMIIPEVDTWSCGVFNPSGANARTDILANMPGDVWFGSETHLTNVGVTKVRKGLKSLQSRYKYFVPGFPCEYRSDSGVGNFSGVCAMSVYPCRPLPHSFDEALYRSARLQVVGLQVRNLWIQAGIMYGFPTGQTHHQPLQQTDVLLDALITRIACEGSGPRMIVGDFNFEAASLPSIQKLRDLGFREAQQIVQQRWGVAEQATGSGQSKIDQLWLSRELQELLVSVSIHRDFWPTHAAVVCHFSQDLTPLISDRWHTPVAFPWPSDWTCNVCPTQGTATEQYAAFWWQLEQQASAQLATQGVKVTARQIGRAQTLQAVPVVSSIAPTKKGRNGDLQPTFVGVSKLHAQWFRQLRRFQALTRVCNDTIPHPQAMSLWKAIKKASGFRGGFANWWQAQKQIPCWQFGFPVFLPSSADIQTAFCFFHTKVQDLEATLGKQRVLLAKQRRQNDLNLIFQDCHDEPSKPLDVLVKSTEVEIAELGPDESVILTANAVLDENLPVVSNGLPYQIIIADSDQVWLTNTQGLQVGDVMRQERVVGTDRALLKCFEEVWASRWTKFQHLHASQWDQILAFVQRVVPPISWDMPQWTGQQFRHIISSKKKKAATGPDGISRKDVLALPVAATDLLAQLINGFENQASWPTQMATGFIKSLDKGKGDGWVDSYRPITVYSLLYRAWSTQRAKCALKSLGNTLPSSIRGGIPARQAKSVWFEVAQMVELAQATDSSLCGLAIDIRRAFNSIPRLPIWAALQQMNFPTQILRAWCSFVSAQNRHFTVRQSVGNPIQSNVGFPEGCALSVFAMSILDWMLDLWIAEAAVGPCNLFAYVDDWQWVFPSIEQYSQLWHSLSDFTRSWTIEIDLKKSFAWALDGESRKAMTSQTVSVVYAAKDLGAHQNFCKRAGNIELQKRLDKLPIIWTRMKLSFSPYRYKLVALYQLGWPKALHGISITNLGRSHFQSLRTGAMKGLNVAKVGANPCLHLCLHDPQADPEFFALYQTVRECRELGQIDQLRSMLQLLSADPSCVPRNGPTFLLAKRLACLGWQLQKNGLFQDEFGSIDVFGLHLDALYQRIKWGWAKFLQCELAHRSSFRGLQRCDLDEVSFALTKFGTADQAYLRSSLDGTLFLDIHKEKSERGRQSRCVFCQQTDSFNHRIWHCPHFQQARELFPWLDQVHQLPPCLANHGWPVVPHSWISYVTMLNNLPLCPKDPVCLPKGELIDVFTDGSCMHPKDPKLRLAAWAITAVCPGGSVFGHKVIQCGHLAGQHQTAYRAELTAVVEAIRLAVRSHRKMRLWSDCMSVLNRVRRIFLGGSIKLNSKHSDLWQQLGDLYEQGASHLVTVHKVVSHCSQTHAETDLESWAFWHNQMVDEAAERCNNTRSDEFWQCWRQMALDVATSRRVHHEVLKVHLAAARMGDSMVPPSTVGRGLRAPKRRGKRFVARDGNQEPVVPVPRTWTFSKHLGRRCGHTALTVLQQWWEQFGVPACKSQQQLQWISGLHLFLDFFFQTKCHGLVIYKGRWYSQESDIPGDVKLSVGQRAKGFMYALGKFFGENKFLAPKKLKRPSTAALSYWSLAYRLRWPQWRLDLIDHWLLQKNRRQLVKVSDLEGIVLNACDLDFAR